MVDFETTTKQGSSSNMGLPGMSKEYRDTGTEGSPGTPWDVQGILGYLVFRD